MLSPSYSCSGALAAIPLNPEPSPDFQSPDTQVGIACVVPAACLKCLPEGQGGVHIAPKRVTLVPYHTLTPLPRGLCQTSGPHRSLRAEQADEAWGLQAANYTGQRWKCEGV